MTNTINRQKLLVVSSKKPVLVLYNPVVGTPPGIKTLEEDALEGVCG